MNDAQLELVAQIVARLRDGAPLGDLVVGVDPVVVQTAVELAGDLAAAGYLATHATAPGFSAVWDSVVALGGVAASAMAAGAGTGSGGSAVFTGAEGGAGAGGASTSVAGGAGVAAASAVGAAVLAVAVGLWSALGPFGVEDPQPPSAAMTDEAAADEPQEPRSEPVPGSDELPEGPETDPDPAPPAPPAERVEPEEPAVRVEPEEPAVRVEPEEPAVRVEPVEPDEPAEPVEPVEPVEPDEPAEPVEPVEPDEPAEPDEPVEPVEPRRIQTVGLLPQQPQYPVVLSDEVDLDSVTFATETGSVNPTSDPRVFRWQVPPGQLVNGRAALILTASVADGTVWEQTLVLTLPDDPLQDEEPSGADGLIVSPDPDDPVWPVAADVEVTAVSRVPLEIDVLADATPSGADLDPEAVTVTEPPLEGTVEVVNGRLWYVSGSGSLGPDELDYQICDVDGWCASGRVAIEVEPRRIQTVGLLPQQPQYPVVLSDDVVLDSVTFATETGSVNPTSDPRVFQWQVPPGQLVNGRAALILTASVADGTVWEQTLVLTLPDDPL